MMLIPRRNFDIFDDLFSEPFFQTHESKVMKTDIKEHEDKYELIIDLPGFNKEDIKMHIENGYIVINSITESDIKATFKNGTLNIDIPKKNEKIKQEEKKYIEIGE